MNEVSPAVVTQQQLAKGIRKSAFALRGFDVKNLGRTPELLFHPKYGPIMEKHLRLGSEICADTMKTPVDLVKRVSDGLEPTLDEYHESIALIVAAELAQLEMLETFFDISITKADMIYGFSLGELAALTACGTLTTEDALKTPLAMSRDAAELAHDTTLCILFSRSDKMIPRDKVKRLCAEINAEGRGVIGVSAYLTPNSMLLIGQGDTVKRLRERKDSLTTERISLHLNDEKWPPLHTPIVWQRNITNRSQVMMHTFTGGFHAPSTPLFSLVTGAFSYNDHNVREILGDWIDKPQLLWEAIDTTLLRGVETVIHVGPHPNIFPATFGRLATNVSLVTKDSFSAKTLSRIVQYGWLWSILPKRASLLRAPKLVHVILEDWLLAQAIP